MVSTLDQVVADDGATVPSSDGSARREWKRAVTVGIGALVVSRLIVLFGGYARAAQVVTDRQGRGNPFPQSTRPMIEAIFTQWDGKWYRMIAENGYPSDLPERITYITGNGATVAFFPVYPVLARLFDVVFPGGIVQALLGVNVVLSVVAVVLVGLLARDLYGIATAQRAMVLFALFPGSVVMSWSYAEPALIVCAAACLLFLQRDQWVLAGLAAAIGTATRPNGVAIFAACVVAAAIAIYRKRQWGSLISVALAPLGVLGYHAYLRIHTGEWGAWNRAQRDAWNEGWSWGATAIRFTWRFLENPLGTVSGATYLHTTLALAMLAFRAVLLDPGQAAVADADLCRRDRRVDDRARNGLGATTVRVHGVPTGRRHRGVVAAPAPRVVGCGGRPVRRGPCRGGDVLRIVRRDPVSLWSATPPCAGASDALCSLAPDDERRHAAPTSSPTTSTRRRSARTSSTCRIDGRGTRSASPSPGAGRARGGGRAP